MAGSSCYAILPEIVLRATMTVAYVVLKVRSEHNYALESRIKEGNAQTLEMLVNLIELRSLESGKHVNAVKQYTRIMLENLMEKHPEYGLTSPMVRAITDASSTHDIGKILIPDEILLKPGSLSDEEFEVMKTHTERGKAILDEVPEEFLGSDFIRYSKEKGGKMAVRKIADYIFEVDTFTELDYAYAENYQRNKFDLWQTFAGGGCTCVVKKTDDGQVLAGRNMDLTISNKPAYVIRTKCPDAYETIGVSYFYAAGPDYADVLEHGVPEEYLRMLPFMCCDVMNSEGLYVEINMRNGEFYDDGSSKFGCSGTKPGAEHRICSMNLCRYIGEKCANIDEALKLVTSLDIYTPTDKNMPWNFTFMLAEKSGRHGLIEIAENKVSWIEGQSAQANFYLTEEFAKDEEMKCGFGRYELVTKGIENVQSEDEIFELINRVRYSLVYSKDPGFDVRSEYVGVRPHWTIDYVMAEENRAELEAKFAADIETVGAMTRQELQDAVKYWESIFTVAANCSKRSLRVRFFEDDSRTFEFAI